MNNEDVKQLLPFYLAGSLDPTQEKEVREALATSEELRKELAFWQKSASILTAQAAYTAAGHLTPQQIVERAEGRIAGDTLLACDRHLQACSVCSEEVARVKQSLTERRKTGPHFLGEVTHLMRSVRLVYAVPVLTVAIIAVVYYSTRPDKQTIQVSPESTPSQAIPQLPRMTNDTASAWLTYQPELRSSSGRTLPTITVSEGQTHLRMVVAIPGNKVGGIQYRVRIAIPGAKTVEVPTLLKRYSSGQTHDSLQFVVSSAMLSRSGNSLTLTVTEVLPPELRSLSPEEYRIQAAVVVTSRRSPPASNLGNNPKAGRLQ